MEEHEHTTRLTAAVDEDPREAAAAHIAETASLGAVPAWVERPGGTVCVPRREGITSAGR